MSRNTICGWMRKRKSVWSCSGGCTGAKLKIYEATRFHFIELLTTSCYIDRLRNYCHQVTEEIIMARHISPNSSTNRTINAIDRKREQERRYLLAKARDNAVDLAKSLVQRLLDEHIIETNSDRAIRETVENQLKKLIDMDEFDMQFKVAPIRSVSQDPNILSLYMTQFVIEDLVEHPNIQDVFGDDLDVYNAVDSIFAKIRPG